MILYYMLKNNTMKYISLFYTHSGAIKFSNVLKKKEINHKILPTPRKLSSNCGISIEFDYEKNITSIIMDDIEKVFLIKDTDYEIVYKSE
ncbi:DUF3343 domain-containing protein [Clostridium amazonitimonense]|uniref:DUF3343 domain-containing protein n=1 Tax=Clostridium amazonitimonense TaxID=1499689 RepID=UPI000A69C9A3|nr:DUF3343 domain-containing protein [Clostridium amazonitimonense]